MIRRIAGTLATLALIGSVQGAGPLPDVQRDIDEREESLAYHIGVQAYVHGYPAVDLMHVMGRETRRADGVQRVYAPVNTMFNYRTLATPGTEGDLRAPNNDTIYFSAWLDLSAGPVVLDVPDTAGRYYTVAISDLYAETEHIGRRTTGTGAGRFLFVPPGWQGALPAGMQLIENSTTVVYLLGRMYSAGDADMEEASRLIDAFRISAHEGSHEPAPRDFPVREDLQRVEFFTWLNRILRESPTRADEAALMAQFDRIGVGPSQVFDLATANPAVVAGLQRALKDGARLIELAAREKVEPGWIVLRDLGTYGYNYLRRAGVVRTGTGANRAEENLYPANLFSADGKLLHGGQRYTLRFEKGGLPPVDAFWSISVYDARTHALVENPIRRYSIGDRTPGLVHGEDGALTLHLQADEPAEGPHNWLPTPSGAFYVIARLYQPRQEALTGAYVLPPLWPVPGS